MKRFCEGCGGPRQPGCDHDWVPGSGAVEAVRSQVGPGGIQFITTKEAEEDVGNDPTP